MPILMIALIYFLPGFVLSQILSGRVKNNPLFILFLSFIATPLTYMILTVYGDVSPLSFIGINALFIFLIGLGALLIEPSITGSAVGVFPGEEGAAALENETAHYRHDYI